MADPSPSGRNGLRNSAWIWFVGCVVWIGDGLVQLHYHSLPRAKLAFMVALMFLAAGLYYRSQKT
jgi:hypothetical protein